MPRIESAGPLDIGRNGLVTLRYVTLYKCPLDVFMHITSFLTCSKFYQTICQYAYPTQRLLDPNTPQDVFFNIIRHVVYCFSSHGRPLVLILNPYVLYIKENIYWAPQVLWGHNPVPSIVSLYILQFLPSIFQHLVYQCSPRGGTQWYFYVCTITLILIWTYLHDNGIF